ncbi:MAG: serine hydrolase [Alphaproteobacteria bacterium]|nr:serine hydrolase [Alphaproteobacteria bacterium]
MDGYQAGNAPMLFPGDDWSVAAPEDHGLDADKLTTAAAAVGEIARRYGFLVVKSGAVVHETYYEGDAASKYHTFSITKGFGATLMGIAQKKGYLDVKDKISDWLPVHHPDIKAGATIEHVMAMTAQGDPENNAYQYTSGPVLNSLPAILWQATGKSPAQFFDEEVAAPLGLTLDWPRNAKGWMQIGSQGPMQVMTATHRDVARLGHLWLNKGVWKDNRLIDESFVDAALTPTFPEANNAYGYLWWLNTDGSQWRDTATPANVFEGRRIPDAPENVFLALGARGKHMFVIPDHDMVVVSMGETDVTQPQVLAIWAAIKEFLPG